MFRRISLLAAVAALLACDGSKARVAGDSGAATVSLANQSAYARPMTAAADGAAEAPPIADAMAGRTVSVKRGAALSATAQELPGMQFSAQGPDDLLSQSMVVRTGSASIQVDSLALGMAGIRALARRVGGYIGNTTMQSEGGGAPSATLELRVPSARFDEAVAGVEALGKTENVHVSAEDVGEQYVDLAARLANSKKLELRLIELLASRTGRLSDIVQVEEKLSQIRGEIERVEGRMRWLRSHASVSTISITVHQPFPLVAPSGAPNELIEAMRQAWRNFISLLAGLISMLGILVPIGALVAGGWTVWRRHSRRTSHSLPEPTAA